MMAEQAFSSPTGRVFIYDSEVCEFTHDVPDHDQWAVWVEYQDNEGGLWYVSDDEDCEDYTLNGDEFGPFKVEDVLSREDMMRILRRHGFDDLAFSVMDNADMAVEIR